MFLLLAARASNLFHITAAHEENNLYTYACYVDEYTHSGRWLALKLLAASDPAWLQRSGKRASTPADSSWNAN